jgi:metal-dependent HD superfamily phosphatase/phosphodiesterase
VECLTLEGNILKLADALDLTKGRARLPYDGSRRIGMPNSVPVVDEVSIHRAKPLAVQVIVRLSQSDGLPAVEALLQEKLRRVPLAGMVEVLARVEGQPSMRLVPLHVWTVETD